MNIGKLDRLVTINSVVNTRGTSGGTNVSYTEWKKVYMSKRDVSGSEGMETMRDTGTTKTIFKTRYLTGLRQDHQLLLDGVNYDIEIIKELGRREGQELICIAKY